MTRADLLAKTGLSDGGSSSNVVEKLVNSGFVTAFYAFGKKKKEMRYRLTDEFSLFYLQIVEDKRSEGTGTWQLLSQTQSWKRWSGYAFENICLKHVPAIKKALGISGV